MKPNWDRIQEHLEQELIPNDFLGEKTSEETATFIRHVSEHLMEAMKRGKPEISKTIILQLNALKAIHGIQISQEKWQDFLSKAALVLKIGVLFLL